MTEPETALAFGLQKSPAGATRPRPSWRDGLYVFRPVWSPLLRVLHWTWVTLITLLVVTGFEIETMEFTVGTSRIDTGFFFGYVRLVHFACGWLLAAVILLRIADLLFGSNPHENWRGLIPARSLRDVGNFFAAIGEYLLLRNDEGKKYLGHDPLSRSAFVGIYLVMILAVLSGLALYGLYAPRQWFFRWFEWPVHVFGATPVRLFHVAMMWLILVFIPLHLYLVVRADGYARAGSLSAMISGGRWVRKGAHLQDE